MSQSPRGRKHAKASETGRLLIDSWDRRASWLQCDCYGALGLPMKVRQHSPGLSKIFVSTGSSKDTK